MDIVLVGILAVLGGMTVALQGQFMGVMDTAIGTRESMFITYAGGGLVITLVTLFLRGGNLRAAASVPWYVLATGLLGLVIVGTIGFTVPRLGLTTALVLVIAGQFLTSLLIERFGWFGALPRPFEWTRLLGVAFLLLGVWLTTRK
ncbi:MAG: DMT family transporter [Anaerolineae bacterium CFX3]|nr:DMT family transporter [Anaerolineae bacterium]MCE7905253.1 DMT family transporter [Anaerolineae bacterium CFX3]MCL4824834.1 DMT family transporter [Anaerolineales bacterium]MCQ3945344.1 EamA-like transporter family protein [Anaerolineae bacterium]RIK24851.1 MAG: EamA-like transporter family protein [Anaerolineae bacterium]